MSVEENMEKPSIDSKTFFSIGGLISITPLNFFASKEGYTSYERYKKARNIDTNYVVEIVEEPVTDVESEK